MGARRPPRSRRRPLHLEGREPPTFPLATLPGDLVTLLALDAPTTLHILTAATLASWEVTFTDALARAVANLEARIEPRWTSPQPGVYVSAWQDDYDSSRILVDRALRGLAVDGRMVAIIPDRNCLIVTDLDKPEALAAAFTLAAEHPKPRPLSLIPLVRRWPTWEALDLSDAHPCYPLWRRLVLSEQASIYAQQQERLRSLFDSLGRDVFVASFVVAGDDGGPTRSRAVWTAGVSSFLPETELLGLLDPSRPKGQELLGWFETTAVSEHAGHLLGSTDFIPRRYQVDGFPSAQELARIRSHEARP
jgi:hypothetical protein